MARARVKLDPHSTEPRDQLELIARLLVGSSYRVPVEGRGSAETLRASDVAAAVGYMTDRLEQQTALAVATRAERREIARLSALAYRKVMRAVLHQRPRPLDLHDGADRWRLRMITYDAAFELVWPERSKPFGALARDAKMRKGTYIAVHKCATSVLQQALNDGRREFSRLLWGDNNQRSEK